MDDDGGVAEDERSMELSSIAAIYPEMVVDERDPYTATLDLAVTPLTPLRILFRAVPESTPATLPTASAPSNSASEAVEEQQQQLDEHELSHLPPLSLRITLPKGYPADKPPAVAIATTPPWLPASTIAALHDHCAQLWEELGRDQVVFSYIDYLQQQTEIAFGLQGQADLRFSPDLKLSLLALNLRIERDIFERGTFDCGVCLEPKKGKDCYKLSTCGHVFCVQCLQDFYKSCITEGDVERVTCLDPSCGKEEAAPDAGNQRGQPRPDHDKQDKTLSPSELILIPIEQDLIQRYVRIKRKKELEADKYTVYCPRTWCQGAAQSKKELLDEAAERSDSDAESGAASATTSANSDPPAKFNPETLPMALRLSVCLDCSFAFCCVCMKSWHGEYAYCSRPRTAELAAEEKASLDYIDSFSSACPTCDARYQKSHGCNHMICTRCRTHFCYLCSSYLDPRDPYWHYNKAGTQCYYRLWDLEGGDGLRPELALRQMNNDGADDDQEPGPVAVDWDLSSDDEFDGPILGADEVAPVPPAAPDPPPRDVRIEIVNFARPGANQVFQLPQRPREQPNPPPPPPPPQAPNPPRPRRRRRRPGLGDRRDQAQRDAARQQERVDGNANANGNGPVNGGRFGVNGPGRNGRAALERFLQLAREDNEDEWDSDELDDI